MFAFNKNTVTTQGIFTGSLFYLYLYSVLKTFLHDPLVEWSKPVKGNTKAQVNETGEIVNEKVSCKKRKEKNFKSRPEC